MSPEKNVCYCFNIKFATFFLVYEKHLWHEFLQQLRIRSDLVDWAGDGEAETNSSLFFGFDLFLGLA